MAIPNIKNSVGMSVTAVADSGEGAITCGAALSGGYQTAATAYGANANIDIRIEEGDTWDVCRDCTYTHSGTTVTRGTQEDGSSGTSTRVAFTSAAKVYVIEPAARVERAIKNSYSIIPGGRLTLESGVPVSTTDQTAKTTIYYTPYMHNVVTLWDGSDWVPTIFGEKSLALGTVTSGICYDVFGYLSAGELALEMLAWTDATTRATGVSLQDGRYCKTGDKTRLLLGTIAPYSTTQISDTETYRGLSNLYNKVTKRSRYSAGDSSHTYTANSSMREYNGTTETNLVTFVLCQNDFVVSVSTAVVSASTYSGSCAVSISYGSSTSTSNLGANAFAPILTSVGSATVSGVAVNSLSPGLITAYLCDRNTVDADLTANYGSINLSVNQ